MNTKKFKYSYPTRASLWEQQVDWLKENFGTIGENWDYSRTRFWFKTEQDKLWFLLRWA